QKFRQCSATGLSWSGCREYSALSLCNCVQQGFEPNELGCCVPNSDVGSESIMKANLFYDDDAAFLDLAGLRGEAHKQVRSSTLICGAVDGDREAAIALHKGFWPFVREFQITIDHHRLPRLPLKQKFGDAADQKFGQLAEALREMKREEG